MKRDEIEVGVLRTMMMRNGLKAERATSGNCTGLARAALAGLLVLGGAQASFASDTSKLKPVSAHGGADMSPASTRLDPDAPLQILVSLAEQKLDVYRGTKLISSSRVSSGKPGHSTPTGVFSILEKRKRHFSNLYDNAPMPYMQRLTWSGIALHQGHVPNRPASHGCVRLPKGFAADLYSMTERGGHVIVTRGGARPDLIESAALPGALARPTEVASLSDSAGLRPGLPVSDGEPAAVAVLETMDVAPLAEEPLRILITRHPPVSRVRELQRMLAALDYGPGPVDGVAGRMTRAATMAFQNAMDLPATGEADDVTLATLYREAGESRPRSGRIYVRRKFREIYSSDIDLADADAPLGTHLYTLIGREGARQKARWMSVTAASADGADAGSVLDRITWTDEARAFVEDRLAIGSSLMVTDRPFRLHSGLGTDFVVMTRQ